MNRPFMWGSFIPYSMPVYVTSVKRKREVDSVKGSSLLLTLGTNE
jgi:hypothetical protein